MLTLPEREKKHIIFTCSNDESIKFWDLQQGNENTENNDKLDFENEMSVIESINYALATSDLKYCIYALLDGII